MDIQKFCKEITANAKPDKEMNGEVVKCLKNAFKQSRLSNKCEKEMAEILREQAIDIHLNPLLRVLCKNELETICQYNEYEDSSKVEECLKTALLEKKIPTIECQQEVASMIQVSQADIQVDPLLQQACALDILKFCKDVPQGNGRRKKFNLFLLLLLINCTVRFLDIKCLKIMSDKISNECQSMLVQRLEMLRNALAVSRNFRFLRPCVKNEIILGASTSSQLSRIVYSSSRVAITAILFHNNNNNIRFVFCNWNILRSKIKKSYFN